MQHKIVTGLILSNKTNKTIKNDLYNNNIIENINDISTKYPPRQILGFKILNLPLILLELIKIMISISIPIILNLLLRIRYQIKD